MSTTGEQLHDILDVEAQLKPLPIEAMRRLARHFTDSALNRRCRSERDARLRDLAQTYEAIMLRPMRQLYS